MFAPATISCNRVVVVAEKGGIHHPLQRPTFPCFRPSSSSLLPKSLFLSESKSNTSSLSLKTSVAVAPNQLASFSEPAQKQLELVKWLEHAQKYYFVVANAQFMLDEEEHFQEQLFERLRYYGERNKEVDFWLVIEPKFLDKFPNITSRLKRPAVALVSANGPWITFMKLRLDRVLSESFEAASIEEALASNPANLEFKKPDDWVAPYPKYELGWWNSFLPQVSSNKSNA